MFLNYCSECPSVFVPDAKMNDNKDMFSSFISFNNYENVIFFFLLNQLLPEHGKTCTSCTNKENYEK